MNALKFKAEFKRKKVCFSIRYLSFIFPIKCKCLIYGNALKIYMQKLCEF